VARVSKWLVLGLSYTGYIMGLVLICVGVALVEEAAQPFGNARMMVAGVAACIPGLLVLLGGIAAWLFLLHRASSAIQDGQARTPPGKAVGLLLIPLLNLWWLTQAFPGFAHDFNSFRERHRLPCEPLNESLFMVYCICVYLGNVPYVGVVSPIGVLIMLGIIGSAMADRVNAIADAQAGGYAYQPV